MTSTRLILLFVLPILTGADWPQFLGPNRDGTSRESVAAWSKPPTVLWRAPLGPAHSSLVVAEGVVYAFAQPGEDAADELTAFDAKTGDVKWRKQYSRAKFTPPFGDGPRSTPAVSGGRVFTFGSTGILTAWSVADGSIAWQLDTLKQFDAKNLFFGISASPVVAEKRVVVPVGGANAGLIAVAADTGKVVWQSTDDPASYASPIIVGTGPEAQVLALTGDHIRAVNLSDGKPVWAVPFRDKLNESSTTPVVADQLVIASSVTRGSVALANTASGSPAEAWKNPKLTCYFSTPVPVGEHLYAVIGQATLFNATISLQCVETKTGKVLWTEPKLGQYHAAIVHTADNKLLMLDDTGRLSLIQPDPTKYKLLAQSKVCGETWAHPALADGVVYVRDNKELLALQLEKPQ